MNNTMKLGFAVLIFLAFAGIVSSAGISLSYWEENPLQVYAGQKGCFHVGLQNGVGDQDLVFDLSLGGDTQLVTLEKTEHYVEAGKTDYATEVCYSIPESAQVGEKYSVSISARTRSPNVEGGIEVGVGTGRNVPIIIVEKPVESLSGGDEQRSGSNTVWYVLLIVVVIAVVLYFAMKKRKK